MKSSIRASPTETSTRTPTPDAATSAPAAGGLTPDGAHLGLGDKAVISVTGAKYIGDDLDKGITWQ